MLVGLDDTDSAKGMCTTYLAALICRELKVKKPPRLIRLNPNIPYRTRGNGAVAFRIKKSKKSQNRIIELVKEYSHLSEANTNPGLVFVKEGGNTDLTTLHDLYKKTVSEYVPLEEAERAARRVGAEVHKFNNGRGIIGALAAVGADLSEDRTYEIIAYRCPCNYGTRRKVDVDSIFKMDEELYPNVFNNVDYEKKRVLILPHGPDPVYCGIRGESVDYVRKAWSIIRPLEEIEFTQVFETNQGTDAHIMPKSVGDVRPYDCVRLEGVVCSKPGTIAGGHVIFGIKDDTGLIDCAAYKPTGGFRNIVRHLIQGDFVRVFGSVSKYPDTVNLEKLEILSLVEDSVVTRPVCCGKVMTSAGLNKGFKCRKCGSRKPLDSKSNTSKSRRITLGLFEVPPRARRHLNKPLVRCR